MKSQHSPPQELEFASMVIACSYCCIELLASRCKIAWRQITKDLGHQLCGVWQHLAIQASPLVSHTIDWKRPYCSGFFKFSSVHALMFLRPQSSRKSRNLKTRRPVGLQACSAGQQMQQVLRLVERPHILGDQQGAGLDQ